MGSGQGKTRRARATAALQGAHVDFSIWDNFVQEQCLDEVTFAEYYDAEACPTTTNKRGENFVLKKRALMVPDELLRDFVDTGTIVLPADVDVNEFFFEIEAMPNDYDPDNDADANNFLSKWYNNDYGPKHGKVEWLFLRRKKSPASEKCFRHPRIILNNNATMGSNSNEMRIAMTCITLAAYRILRQG